jgi:hypothetical protein
MSKQLIAIGIIFSMGTVGCAGLGGPQASSLTAQLREERGLDDLWMPARQTGGKGLETPHYAGEGLGNLWQRDEVSTLSPTPDPAYYERRSGGDLWNPASVVRSWEPKPRPSQERPAP